MKRQTLVNGLLSITAISLMTGCVDDKYDLSDIDTTSRFTVDNLTVPIKISKIKLQNVVNLDDNENIQKVKIDGKECYAIVKDGKINPTEFNIGGIHIGSPSLNPSLFSVAIVDGGVEVPGVGLDLPAIALPEIPLQSYNFNMHDVDKALQELKNVKTTNPIKIEVTLTIPQVLAGSSNKIAFQNMKIQLPWGLITDQSGYDQESGMLSIAELPVEADGKARLVFDAFGLDLDGKGKVVDGNIGIAGNIGIEAGEIKINVKDETLLPSSLDIRADYYVSDFDIASFNGRVDYNMDAIHIDPISLNDLPDFLDNPETNIIIANPQIIVDIINPVGEWLDGKGRIILTSNFKNGDKVSYSSDEFTLSKHETKLAFCTEKTDATFVQFDGLRNVLSNGDAGLPSSIEVDIEDINFSGDVKNFPLGDLGSAEGSYEFNAPLGFGVGSMVIYETTVDGWSSDTLDDVNINKIHLTASCSTNLPVSVQLSVTPIDKNGMEIAVREESALFEVPAKAQNHTVFLSIESVNGPIKNLDGVKFHAVVYQNSPDNEDALGPDLQISLDQIRVTVDGYYETDF